MSNEEDFLEKALEFVDQTKQQRAHSNIRNRNVGRAGVYALLYIGSALHRLADQREKEFAAWNIDKEE